MKQIFYKVKLDQMEDKIKRIINLIEIDFDINLQINFFHKEDEVDLVFECHSGRRNDVEKFLCILNEKYDVIKGILDEQRI